MTTFKDERFDVPQTDIDGIEPTEPKTLQECLDFAREFDDYEPLENAIYSNDSKIERAQELLKQYIDECGQMTNGIVKSRFTKILNVLR